MKKSTLVLSFFLVSISLFSCKKEHEKISDQISAYIPVDRNLYEEILAMDKEFFDAYNHCDLKKQDSIYSGDIEFFHDTGGLMTSKKEIIEATERNICGKVSRELISGTVEVYPINNYGAVEIGFHKFHNIEEPDAESIPSKFIIMWRLDHGNWKISKVISLH